MNCYAKNSQVASAAILHIDIVRKLSISLVEQLADYI